MNATQHIIHPNTQFILERLKNCSMLPTVLIFHGPKSEAKQDHALALIEQIINKLRNPIVQKRILEKNHPDVQFYSADGLEQYAIATVKTFIEEASLPPFELEQKWIVVDEAEKLTTIHCNMLLKTLEEPPSGVHFLMITDSLESLLPTILSRSIKVPFFPQSKLDLLNLIQEDKELQMKSSLMAGLLQGSSHLKPLIVSLDHVHFFDYLFSLVRCYAQKKPEQAFLILETIDELTSSEDFVKKNLEIFHLSAHYYMQLLQVMGQSDAAFYRYVPKFYELYDNLEGLMKRYTKLKHGIERLACSLAFND